MSASSTPLRQPVRVSAKAAPKSALLKKFYVAVAGGILTGWVFLHMAGTLGVFAGPETMNGYARLLRETHVATIQRVVVASMLIIHSMFAMNLVMRTRRARPVPYARTKPVASTLSGRSMRFTGPLILAWLIYHVLHLYGPAHPNYLPGDVHHNLVTGLASPWVALSYVVATLLFALHLEHGVVSLLQTLGAPTSVRRGVTPLLRGFVVIVTVGFLLPVLAAQVGYF